MGGLGAVRSESARLVRRPRRSGGFTCWACGAVSAACDGLDWLTASPGLVGVQAELLAPVCEAFADGLEDVPGLALTSPTLAEGLAITKPIRGQRVLEAIRSTGGTCVSVTEDEIAEARREAALQGFDIEPTSATAWAAVMAVLEIAGPDDLIVVPLTGSGLKGSPTLE